MEALKEIIEIFKEFDGNNVWIVIGISAVLLFIAAGYIQLLNASKIEAILMDQKEESKRFGFIYLILFAVFGIINYIFIIDIELVLANVVLWFLTLVSPVILKKLKNKWRFEEVYWWLEERKVFFTIMTSTVILIFVVANRVNINIISWVVLGTLVAVLSLAIIYLNIGNAVSNIILVIEDNNWYVFKRIDEKYLLCGNKRKINDSTKTRLFSIDYIVEQNLCFEKENTSAE